MDGLMLNTEDLYWQVGQEMMQRRGREYREPVRRGMMGLPARQAWQVLIEAEDLPDTWEALQAECDAIFDRILADQVRCMPGLLRLLDLLDRRGLPRCVATSSRRDFASKALKLAGVLDRVDFVVTSEDVLQGKPHPDIYLLASQRMGAQPDQVLVLEDSPHGARAGVSAQACVIAVPGPHGGHLASHRDFPGVHRFAKELMDPEIVRLVDRRF
jgi:HAD superfamily hydrolase (TIGR01509 family)